MKASFYKKLQDDFVMIRFMQYQDSFDQEKYDSTVLSIREARKKINMHSSSAEKNILLYCIDTLFEIINEGDKQKNSILLMLFIISLKYTCRNEIYIRFAKN